MPTFTNQATLSYNNITTNSNVVTGQLLEVISAVKTAVGDTYSAQEVVTYVVSVLNSGTTAINGLTVTDDLGAYTFGTETLYPLDYIPGSIRYYINGVLQAAPAATTEPPLTVTGINIPAGGNAILVYEARVNQYAPLAEGSTINNTVTITGDGLSAPVIATDTITAASQPQLTISKSICPATVAENGQLTYTFVIQNSGSQPADADVGAVIRDVFDPILEGVTVAFDGTPWVVGTNYTYDQATGEFATVAGQVTVPAATYVQDPTTGLWSIQPGTAVLTVTGTV
ncbi:MAG: hypothetical protein IKU58_00620 [Clostridia bacterium]|nr:hypothetical protein [Clostridia bacterium]